MRKGIYYSNSKQTINQKGKKQMNTSYTSSMFEKIKESLNKKSTGSGFKDVLKFVTDNTYVVRLLPNVHDPKNTIFSYTTFGWNSRATGQYMSVVSPLSFGERCPINEIRYKLYQGSDHEKSLAKLIKRNNQWLVNCYVINNPTSPETEGQVKIIRFGKQLHKIITDAITGDDAEEYGPSIFDLSNQGNNLRIKVEKNEGNYATYVSSKFLKAAPVPGVEGKEESIYNSAIDLSKIVMVKSYEEIKEIINVHLLKGEDPSNIKAEAPASKKFDPTKPVTPEHTQDDSEEISSSASSSTDEITEEDIENLLKDL